MQINIKNVDELSTDRKSEDVLIRAIKNFRLKKEEWRTYLVMIIICLFPAVMIGMSENTVSVFLEVISDLLNTFLSLFGIVFTGYAFFQALMNKPLLIAMINEENKDKKESKFKETNNNFVELMMLYVIGIIISLVIKFIVSSVPETYGLFPALAINNVCASLLIVIYLFFAVLLIWRMISFLYNIFQLFNLHAAAKAIEIINEEQEKQNNDKR